MSYHREAAYKANLIDIQKADPAKLEEYKHIFDNSALTPTTSRKSPSFLSSGSPNICRTRILRLTATEIPWAG